MSGIVAPPASPGYKHGNTITSTGELIAAVSGKQVCAIFILVCGVGGTGGSVSITGKLSGTSKTLGAFPGGGVGLSPEIVTIGPLIFDEGGAVSSTITTAGSATAIWNYV